MEKFAQRNSWNDVIPFIGRPILIIISLFALVILLVLLDELFWKRIEHKIMEYTISRNIIDNYSYLVREDYYKNGYSYKKEKELKKFLTCLKKVKDKYELIKLKEDAMILFANTRIASRELKDYFKQIGMTEEEFASEAQKYKRRCEPIESDYVEPDDGPHWQEPE